MFSRTRIRSTPSKRVARPGIDFTGRTQAKSSSDWRSSTFALLKPPAIGVVMGPFKATPALRMAFSTCSGMGEPYLAITSPPASTRSQAMRTPLAATTRTAASVTSGPMPSPGISTTRWGWLDIARPISYGSGPSGSHPRPRFGEPAVSIQLLCRKLGMTQIFAENGDAVSVTVLDAGPNTVVQKKTVEHDGYTALQVGIVERRPTRTDKAQLGHFQKAKVAPKRFLEESRVTPEEAAAHETGGQITVEVVREGPARRRDRHLEGTRHAGRRAAPSLSGSSAILTARTSASATAARSAPAATPAT